ncbi:MAG: hypothetical protein WC682_01160 [Parcubacteria group bacterium]|jgi:hypothetical protein
MFIQLLLFFASLVFLLFLPGYFLLLAIFKKNLSQRFLPIETIVIAFSTSLIIFDFLIIFFGKLNFNINRNLILILFSAFILACYALYKFKKNKKNYPPIENDSVLKFSSNQSALIILILFLTIFIKTIYLTDAIFPTSTDLGHHMYWSKLISQTGQLPDYKKNEIISINDNSYQLQSQPIADFIIGEHLIFAGINLLTRISFISYFPALLLFAINIFSLLAMFILALRIFDSSLLKNILNKKIINPVNLAILTLFLIGPFYAITSPQAKFVSGGVIGNLIGNLLIPLCLYFYFRAIQEKNSWMLFMGLFLSAGIFYTHHLSGFIFIFILVFTLIIFNVLLILKTFLDDSESKIKTLILNYKKTFKDIFTLIYSPQIIIFLISTILFLFFVYMPSYITTNAQTTVVGAPSKSTRAGLTLNQFKYAVGEMRLTLGIIGSLFILALVFLKNKFDNQKNKNYHYIWMPSILLGWALALTLMTVTPQWLHINIPSDRVANYANFPFIFLASIGLIGLISFLEKLNKQLLISKKIFHLIFVLFFVTIIFGGYYDNANSLSLGQKNQKALQTFHASEFLSSQIRSNKNSSFSNVLKDHNYLSSDSWIKLFFMQDYNYPLSRGYFKRYEDSTKPREMCTLWMINEPSSERAQKCFSNTFTKYIIINTSVDEPQFKATSNFSKVYQGDSLSIFSKNNH